MMNNTESHSDSHESVQEYLPEFLSRYSAKTVKDINCIAVSDADLERLGDAVMETNHPGEAHEAMDQMMGGEGSESLEQMHINMGRSFLGCYTNNSQEVVGMGYMMGGNYGSWHRTPMMNNSYGYLWGINSLLISVLLVVLIRFFWIKAK